MAGREAPSAERAVLFGRFRLFPARRLLLEGDRIVRLVSRAFELLTALVERPGEVVGSRELIARVWPNTVVVEHNLKVQVATLRRALGDGGEGGRYLIAVPGRGYSFVAPTTYEVAEPASRAAAAKQRMHNLPAMLTRLIGRTETVGKLSARLRHERLLSIVGPGGIGKTSVALAVAEALIAEYENGVWLVDLAPIGDAGLVASNVATVLGVEIRSDDTLAALTDALQDQRMLIVLDNCEHVIDSVAQLAAAVLRSAPGVHLLATSREPLRVRRERQHSLFPLPTPPASGALTAAAAQAFPAVQLFVERAKESDDNFALADSDIAIVADICRGLDGIPLAIELAAARASALGVRGLASLLGDRLGLLTYGRRADVARHQTMRATLDWSYGLLSPPERKVLRRLGVFAGGFTLRAAGAVIGDAGTAEGETATQVLALVTKSLVVEDLHGVDPRYRLLEIVRAYALEKLKEAGEYETVAPLHAEYYRDFLEAAGLVRGETAEDDWRAICAPEIDNLRAALAWAFGHGGDAAVAVALASASATLWIQMSVLTECRRFMEAAIARLDDAGAAATRQEMIVQTVLGLSIMYTDGSASMAYATLTRVRELAESLQDVGYEKRALVGLAFLCFRLEDFDGALRLARRAEATAEGITDAAEISDVRCVIGLTHFALGEYAEALPYIKLAYRGVTSVEQRARIGRYGTDYSILARSLEAHILWHHGLLDQSAQAVRDVIAHARGGSDPASLFHSPLIGCRVSLLVGDLEMAEHLVSLLKDHTRRHGFGSYQAMALGQEGQLSAERGDIAAAKRLLRACLDGLRDAGFQVIYTEFLGVLAAVLLMARDFDASLASVDEALRRIESSRGDWLLPETLRIKGEILRLQAKVDTRASEECFHRSLEAARLQGSLSGELRTATSLARAWRDQGRGSEAHELLALVYGRFSEGFGTADLRAARQLLDQLKAGKETSATSES